MSAQETLERLFLRAENAASRDRDGRVTLPLTPASAPEYASLQTLEDFDAYHGAMAMAERAGCIALTWTRTGGTARGIARVTLIDHAGLAAFLGRPLRREVVASAQAHLREAAADFPVIDALIKRWRAGKLVRGAGPDAAQEVVDAVRVAREAGAHRTERLLRMESVRLFGNTKRIENLLPWLDLLACGELSPSGLATDEVLAQFGLRRIPQPALLSGHALVMVGMQRFRLPSPYVGLPPDQVQAMEGMPAFFLTIENLTTFHEAVLAFPQHQGWILYTGGMPSPAWRALYARLIACAAPECPLYHWGDIDEGGFRIATVLQRVAQENGRTVHPWMMSPSLARAQHRDATFRPSRSPQTLSSWAARAGWPDLAADISTHPWEVEQEALRVLLP